MAYNKSEKLRDNIAAIRTAFDVERSGREATEQEKTVLRRYSGFGGLKFILNPCSEDGDIERWSRSDRVHYAATRELYGVLSDNARDGYEYRAFVQSIRNSVLTSFYTPVPVVQAIAQVMKKQGVEVKSYLDPSAGKGTFVEAFRQTFPDVTATAFEKDLITGKVLKALYPHDQVHVDGFETIDASQQGRYDVVASNIPFGDISVFDEGYARSGNAVRAAATKTIHNYFFLKALDQLREGGFIAFITSRGFMDSPSNNAIREELVRNARLVGAFRLPDGMFADEAGTEVGSDLVILQKYTGYDSSLDPDSLAFCEVEKGFTATSGEDDSHITLNSHWWKSMLAPDSEAFISTKMEMGTDPYGKPTLVFTHDGGTEAIAALLSEYMSRDLYRDYVDYYRLHAPKYSEAVKEQVQVQAIPMPQRQRPVQQQRPAQQEQPVQLSLFDLWAEEVAPQEQKPSMEPRPYAGDLLPHYRNGLIVEDGGQLGHLTHVGNDTTFTPIELSDDQAGRMRLYVKVRDAYEQLYKEESEQKVELPLLREELNRHYDNFLVRYGCLNDRKNARLLLMDGQGRDVLSLENSEDGRFVKSDIFLRPVSFNVLQDGHVGTAVDALSASLNRNGGVDLEYMSSISDFSEEELRDQLKERIYYNPLANGYEIGDKFLAGNVVEKLDELRRWPLKDDMKPEYREELERSITALEAVVPRPIAYAELDFNFGERWMPKAYFSEFATEFFGTDIRIDYAPQLDEFVVDVSGYSAKLSQEFAVTGETKTYDGEDLLRHALYNTVPVIQKCVGYKPNGDAIMGPDHEKIQLAASKIDQIRDGFTEWIDRHPDEWKQSLADMYNRKYNCFVKASYDGGHQTFPGLDLKGLAVSKYQIHDIYKSQKDCVWMLLQNGGGVCDHEVGTGKTMTMCIAAHEMKRLGLTHKPIIIGMKANVAEIAATYQAAYPGERILYATQKDFSDRQNFFNRMKNNDYDCIIMSHDQFTMIPQSADIQRKVLYEEIWAIDEALEVYERQGHSVSGRMRAGLEKRKQNLESQLLSLNATLAGRADDVADFKTMGIDHIFIDESQAFKNLAFTTRDSRVAGLGDPKGSQRARNLQYAIRTIQERTGRDLGATFLSGTTISNSLTELYLLFKYLRPKAMSMQDINSFDAWAAVFARKSRDYEINVAGSIVMKERFRQFIKVPELGAFYNEITDYKTAADVGLERPDMDVQLVNIQPTEDQQDFQQRLLQFAESGDGDLVFRPQLSDSEQKAKMLLVTNMGKKCSLSPKLVNPDYHEGDGTKIGVAAKNISDIYYQYNEQRGTQFVFCDLSTPKKGEWSVYQELKDRLVGQYNIPADQIQFIQDAGTEKKKKEFIDRMNRGDIRVMIGSTTMLGTGVNAQRRAVAVHHLDLPWRPSDMEQRNGRARRKGNEVARDYANNEVKVFVYAVERSLDSYNFYLLQAKSEFIRQMKTGALAKRSFDQGGEDEDNGMPFAEYVAITSGNNDLLERAKLEKRILGLEAERKAFYKQQQVTQQRLGFAQEQVRHFDAVLDKLNSDKTSLEKALAGAGLTGGDVFGQLRENPSLFTFLPSDDPQLSRVRLDLSLPNPYGEFMQQAARHEVNGEVVIARISLGALDWPLAMTSKTEYNPNTGVNRWVGNKVSVVGASGLHYTYNYGKVSLSDKAFAARYPFEALSRIPEVIRDQRLQRDSYARQIPELERIAGKQWEKTEQLKELKEQLQALDRKIQQDMDGRMAQAAQAAKPEELPFTITHKQWGRDPWELQFKVADYPYLNRADRDAMEEKYHGYFRSYDGIVTGHFHHQFGAEESMKELSMLNMEHKDDVEWLKAAARDVHDDSCLPSFHRLRELGLDRFGRQVTGDNAKSLRAVSLGDYHDERVRALAHGVKDGNGVAIDVAASAMAKALKDTPVSKNAVLVSMPGHKGYGGSAQRLAKRLSELTDIPYIDALASGEHESLYDWKKEHPDEELPELFFTEDERYPVPEGKTPVIIDNVIDTGHTAWAAVEAMEAQPILFTIGSTGHEDSEGHDIKLQVHPQGLEYIQGAMPEGVGLTGLSQEELDALLHKAQVEDNTNARRDLRMRGVDWYTGQPSCLVASIVDKWEKCFSDELDPPVRELTGKGTAGKVFSKEELPYLSEQEKASFDVLVSDVKKKSRQGYSFQLLNDKRRLMVVHDYLKEKAATAMEQEALRREQNDRVRYDAAANTWSGIPSDMKVYCSGEPDRIREVYGSTPNEDIDLVYFKAERAEDSFAFVRVWVDDHQAESPAKIVIELEKEGYDVGLHGERGRYVDFDTWDEAVRFEQHVRDIEQKVHAPKAEVKALDSPIMRQFHDLKSKHPDALLLFRVGDFYETYEQDAVEASRILGITLTHRQPTSYVHSTQDAMAGFPHHALDTYLPKLIRAGKRVAICDQLEAPREKPRRGITEMVQPAMRPRLQLVETMDDIAKVLPQDALLRDALMERMREAGIRVNTDVAAAERLLSHEQVRLHSSGGSPVFVSNARRAVERIRQEKAPPEQQMFFLDGNRQAYGFTYEGEIYVDRRVATAETPIHEYTHLWAEVLRQRNPKEWENIVSLMKDCRELWQDVSGRYAHLHDDSDIAEEVLAHYSGQRGYQRLMDDYGHRQDVSGKSILDSITEALGRLWKSVADFLHINYSTKEQVADQVLSDLLNRVNLNDYRIRDSERKVVSHHLTPSDREVGGVLVDYLGRMGITVHTDFNENRRILKAARQDNSEVGKVRHFKTQDGTTYGFAYKGELHLDLRKVDAELPLHEYAHLWCEALRRVNPDNWRNVVSIIRDDAASWQFVKASYPELHDADDIAEEVIAQYSGRRGAEKLRDELARMTPRDADYGSRWGNIFQNVSKAIQDFWKHVGDSLNIRYSSAEDVYDQILNDFARKVNPVAKVERYLKERDTAYQLCVEGGDLDTAAAMFEEALQEHVGNGVTPFMAVDGYRGKLDRLAHEVKGGSDDAVRRAARLMAPLVPTYSVLVPAPSHEGYATDMLALAHAISEETGAPVADVLKGTLRERQYDVKRATGKPMAADAMGIRMEGVLPQGYMPVVIDNVVHSGNTAEACVKALGKGVVLSLASAVSQERHVSSLKSLDPVIYDKNGVLIPLSERFTLKSKYLGRVMNYRPLGEGLQADSYIASNGDISIDDSRLASGLDGDYLVKVFNNHIKLMENKAMEEKKQEEAQVQQEQQPEQKKKGWNIDYTKYSMPEGVSVEKAQVFKLTRGENAGRYGVSAVVDGQRKTQVMYPNDVSAYFAKDEQGNRLASNPTVEQLVAKYFGPKGQEQASAATQEEEVEQQVEQTDQEGLSQQQEQPEQKRKGWNIDYTKYAMPDSVNVEKAQVFKMDQGDNAGKYAVTAVIDGQRKTQVMFKNDVDAYFTKDEQGNRKATAEQLVAKYSSSDTLKHSVSAKEEQQEQQAGEKQESQARQDDGKRKDWNIDYTKYSMPEGAIVTNSFVKKDDKSGKYRLFATINGEFRSADLYPNDRQAFFEKNEAGERKATTEQLVAKYFAKSTAVKMGLAPADTQPQQELKHLGTYDVPVWAVAALQNGTDAYDGLQEDEIAEIEHFQEQFDGPLSFDIHTEERNEFNASPAFGGAGETVKVDVYTFVEKVQRAQAEVRENLEEEQIIEDNGKEQQERKDKEQKRQEEDKEKKEDKQEVSAGLALQTTLLAGALHAASEHDGVWMNRQGKQAPAFMGKDTKISPFNSMVMALHSDANGYKSNLYTTFAAAKNAGVSVRGKEKGLPYNWYDWDKFVNKYIKNEVIDKAAYQALPPEERELYRVQGKKDMKPIFNIDQTTLPMQKKEEYKALVGSEDNVSEEKATPAEQQAARMERFAEMTKEYPDSIKLFRVGENYEIYGADADKAAAVIGLPVDRDESSEANAVSVSVTFPKEDLDTNMAKLVHEGSKVAICDDLEDARLRRLTPEGELYAASDKIVEAIRQTGVDIDSNGATRYDAEKNTLYVADRTQTKPGQEMTLAMERVGDVYRAAVAYTGTDSRLNRGNRERMLPEDRDKYDRLVQELTAGVMMTRQGLPATISAKNRELIPYWERELKEDPRLLDNVERDVNNAVQVIDKIAAGQQVDYAAMRGERPAVAARPRMYTIASELATIPNIDHKQVVIVRDPKEKTASVIMPAGASLDMNNEVPGMNKNRFVVALKHQDVEDVKFYNAGGALGLNQPNEFFADKQVEVAHLKQYELIQDEVIDLTDELARTSQVDIEKVAAIKNDQDEWVFYVKPSEGESVTVKPETTDLARFFSAIQTEQFDSVRQEMGQKYYALVQQHPQLKQDFMMPKVENVDLSRITSASMYKSKLHEDKACVTCVYDDNKRLTKEIDRDSKEWQRLWLVDDQKGYKVAVAAKLFETELNKGQEKGVELTQQEPVRESQEVTVDDDQEEVEEEEQQQTVRTSFHR